VAQNYTFHLPLFRSLIGGLSSLDVPRLNIQSLTDAQSFIRAYGFNFEDETDIKRLWRYHRRAVNFIRNELLEEGESYPEALSDPDHLKDLLHLLIYASTHDQKEMSLQRWACATLKVMHVMVHLDNDLFTYYSNEIQEQLFKPYRNMIHESDEHGLFLGVPGEEEMIPLEKFDVKTFKSSKSSVTKLLAKPEEVAFTLLDKMGIRFVTRHLYDVFRVLRFLMDKNLVSFPHIISDQSNNTLYPLNLFCEVVESVTKEQDLSSAQLDILLQQKMEQASERGEYRQKLNAFSSRDYRFIKFITRSMVRVPMGADQNPLTFFYPYEVQIVDIETYQKSLGGTASHKEYKARQKKRARLRVLGV
jgi:uncharacterized protein (TIGR04562 family)